MRGVLAGALGLLVLHALVARANQAQLSGLARAATGTVQRFLDPAIAAIPDRSGDGESTPPSTTARSSSAYPSPTPRSR